jgi:hypothetical protein
MKILLGAKTVDSEVLSKTTPCFGFCSNFVVVSHRWESATEGVHEDATRRIFETGGAATTLGHGLRDATAGSTSDRVRRGFSLAFPLLSPVRPKSRGS